MQPSLDQIARRPSRLALWTEFLRATEARTVAEIGVFRGVFAEKLLAECPAIERYYMIDPWQHLDDWNKPANREDDEMQRFFEETMARTEFAATKRVVLRGRTTDVVESIPDDSLDFVYIDGDHTLRGVAIDLVRAYAKVRPGGWIGGDDFTTSVWQHDSRFEPTFVFPLAVYFAEAHGLSITALPYRQFALQKRARPGAFEFVDLTGKYPTTSLKAQGYPSLRRRVEDLLQLREMKQRIRATPLGKLAKRVLGRGA